MSDPEFIDEHPDFVPMVHVVEQAKALMDEMDEERRTLPSSAWDLSDGVLDHFCQVAWPTKVGQNQ